MVFKRYHSIRELHGQSMISIPIPHISIPIPHIPIPQAKRESLYIIHHPVSAMTCTALCLKGCGTSPSSLVTTPAPGSEFMLDVTSESRDKNWPIELIVMLHTDNSITVLNRYSIL